MPIARALLSVTDKTGIADFGRALQAQGVEILSTGGTAKALADAGVKVTEIAEYTGQPEILGGRVKTLHPKVHGGILARRDNAGDRDQLKAAGWGTIDLVCVNLYQFRETAAKPGVTLPEAIESIDIGGPAMIRASAKNWEHVAIVTAPAQYARVAEAMKAGKGELPRELRLELATEAFRHTSSYDTAIHAYLARQGSAPTFPQALEARYEKAQDLRYGENPHQKAAFYRDPAAPAGCVGGATQLSGKELSFNNILDLDAALELAREFPDPAVAVIKHNNPCGCATRASLEEAFRLAVEGDPVSAFGGIVAANRAIDAKTAAAMAAPNQFFEAIVAPDFAPEALQILQTKPKWGRNVRLMRAGDLVRGRCARLDLRPVHGGALVQTENDVLLPPEPLTFPHGKPADPQLADLLFAWTVCKHVKSNAIVLARDRATVGVGAGQMSRLDSARIACWKAGERAKGAVIASDAFFPFPDALETCLDAGAVAVIQPGGSVRDEEVMAAAKKRGVPMAITGMRHFRH